jgi:hypothetical protein
MLGEHQHKLELGRRLVLEPEQACKLVLELEQACKLVLEQEQACRWERGEGQGWGHTGEQLRPRPEGQTKQ